MSGVWLIARRELGATIRSPLGFVVVAAVLAVLGLLFNARALGGGEKLSANVLADFFYLLSGATMVASVFISMRLLAEEQQSGTISLLMTSPVSNSRIVLGKFLGGFLFLALMIALSCYMPMLVLVHGKVSLGHVLAGYLGCLLLGAASMGIGTFSSSLFRTQIAAAFVSGCIIIALIVLWLLARVADPPLDDVFPYMALHNKHFFSFMRGKVHLRDIVFYLSVCAFFLAAATRMLESRRWR